MNKSTQLKILNSILLPLFIVQVAAGIGYEYIHYKLFKKIHITNGVLLALVALGHITLNRQWIKATYFRREKDRNMARSQN